MAGEGFTLNGRYRLDEVLGEGGMAVVWLAFDLALRRRVAVKLLRPQFAADPDFVQRFEEEAHLAANLTHPNIVAIYDVGLDDREQNEGERLRYIVIEYVEGLNLKQVLRERGVLGAARAVFIAAQVCDALEHAHSRGLVHRDVKPENILIGPGDQAKVTDFGIARGMASVSLTSPGTIMGTAHFVAPEQVLGRPASPASDIYSLGAVLYEALCGRPPFEADTTEGLLLARTREDPPPLRSLNRSVPSQVEQIVARAMERNPEDRFGSAAEMADALRHYTRWDQATAVTSAMPLARGAAAEAAPEATPPLSRSRPAPGKTEPQVASTGRSAVATGRVRQRQSLGGWLMLFALLGLALAGLTVYLTLSAFSGFSFASGGPPPAPLFPTLTPTPPRPTPSSTAPPTSTPAASPSPTPTATPEPRPTFTPTPLATPTPLPPTPTNTPVPTPLPPNKTLVPNVVGMPEALAQETIVKAGLTAARSNYQTYPYVPPGHVLSQLIPPGTVVDKGTILYIAVRAR